MKKIFTLVLAAMLMGGANVSAQQKWTNLITNGDLEGEPDPMSSNFWCHDYRQDVPMTDGDGQSYNDAGQFNGFAEIVEDPANPENHCLRVNVRSTAEAKEAGNMIEADGGMAGWDSQFFIAVSEPLPEGKMLRLTMKVKADKADPKAGTQAHGTPGNYHHYIMCGDVSFTTEWKLFTWEGSLSSDQAKDGGFQSIAFNLSDYKEGYVAYFDDIKLEVKDPKEISDEESGWVNFIRKGTMSDDMIDKYTTFTGRDGSTGKDIQARIVADPVDGEPALNVTSIAYNYIESETPVYETDEDGNIELDDNGNPIPVIDEATGEPKIEVVKKYKRILDENTGEYELIGIDNWSTQFFITAKHQFAKGEKYKFRLWARASKDVNIETQIHNLPGGYIHWDFVGQLNLTTEWQEFVFGTDDEPYEMKSEGNGGQTMAFNCNVNKDEPIEFYFRVEEFSFAEGMVTPNERVLGTENITLPLAAAKNGTTNAAIDLTKAGEVLGVEDFSDYMSEDPIRIKFVNPDTEEDEYKEVALNDGPCIDAEGNYIEEAEDNCIQLAEDEENAKDGSMALTITNMGVSVGQEKSIDAKIALQKDAWLYLYNVSFIANDDYVGVDEVEVSQKSDTSIYNLAGQKVNKAYKGIVIINGKKVVQ